MRSKPKHPRPWSVELSSDFDTGAGIQLRSPEPGVVTFLAPWDSSPLPMWFHFCIRGAKGWTVRFVLMNANRCLGGESSYANLRVRPVVTDDPPTMRPSERRWRRIPKKDLSHNSTTGQFSFSARIGSDEAYVAHCFPYGLAEWQELVSDFSRNRCLIPGIIGKTAMGRAIPHARITEGPARGKKVIWLTARHHSGETPGSWALEGTLRWLLSDDRRARDLRSRYRFRVVPFADLDGVIEGYYGKERAPLDFNRAYIEDTPRPEVGHILREVLAMGARNLAFFDYHAPGAGGPHQVFLKEHRLGREYGQALVDLSPRRSRLDPKDVEEPRYMGDESETTSTGGVYLATGILTITNEVSYALTRDDRVLTRVEYLAYGASIGKAIHKVLTAHTDAIDAGGFVEQPDHRLPFPEYEGTAFRGGFQWVPAVNVRFSSEKEKREEILRMNFLKKDSSVHLACPRMRMGKRKTLLLAWRFSPRSQKGALQARVTIFYYGPRGLRYRRDQKVSIAIGRTAKWQAYTIRLDPPKGTQTVRASMRISGGRGRFDLRAPAAK
ncbi:MAG: M14-type cytosolic carboxypeptidase [Planctomycetota bacterium]